MHLNISQWLEHQDIVLTLEDHWENVFGLAVSYRKTWCLIGGLPVAIIAEAAAELVWTVKQEAHTQYKEQR